MPEYLPVPDDRVGIELDEFLCLAMPTQTKGFLRRQVREGRVTVDGQPALPAQRLRRGQVVILDVEEEADGDDPVPFRVPTISLTVLHEDEHLLVIDKPAGLAVEPERWLREAGSVAASLVDLAEARSEGDPHGLLEFRPRIVHRLDKGTTGVLLVAKDLEAERELRAAFEARVVEKDYLALVEGEVHWADGEEVAIEHPIAPAARRGGRMCVREGGKPALTVARVEERFRGFTLVRCSPRTGRTHQIRVHMAEEGFPLLVDPVYGRRDALLLSEIKRGYRPKPGRPELPLLSRLSLHALRLRLPDDVVSTSTVREFHSPVPADLERALKQLRKVRPHSR